MEFGRVFTFTLTFIGGATGWFMPFWGLMVYYMFAVIRPPFLWFWSLGYETRHSRIVAISTLVGWVMHGFGGASLRGLKFQMFGLYLWLGASWIAYQFMALNKAWAWRFLDINLKIGLMALVTVTLIQTKKQLITFAWVIAASLGYLAWVFNSQYYFDGWNRIYIRGFGSVDNNGAAMMMVMGVPLCFFMALSTKRLWAKFLCWVAVACLCHVVLFSFSRGGQLGLCMVGLSLTIAAIVMLPRKILTLFLIGAFVTFTFYYAGDQVTERFTSIFVDAEQRDHSAQSRFTTWRAGWQCMLDHPWGVGPRNFNIISSKYGLGPGKSVHNLFLQVGADTGFAGAIGLMMFYFGTFFRVMLMSFHPVAKRLGWPRYIGHAVMHSLGGFLVCSTFIGMESVETGFIISLLGLCTCAYVYRVADEEDAQLLHDVAAREIADQTDEVIDTEQAPPAPTHGGLSPA